MATHQKKHNKSSNKELIICNSKKNEYYGQILSNKGDTRFETRLIINNMTVLSKVVGRLIKGPNKQRINISDFVLLQQYDNSDKYYIIHKYTPDDVKKLKKINELVMYENDDKSKDADEIDVMFDNFNDDDILHIEVNEDFINNI